MCGTVVVKEGGCYEMDHERCERPGRRLYGMDHERDEKVLAWAFSDNMYLKSMTRRVIDTHTVG